MCLRRTFLASAPPRPQKLFSHSHPILSSKMSSDDYVYVVRDGKLKQLPSTRAQQQLPPSHANRVKPTDIPVVSMQRCACRIQNPNDVRRGGDPQRPDRSTIPPQTFTHTVAQVDASIRDYNNQDRQNIALWLEGDYALRYAGIDKRLSNTERMTPQPKLAESQALVTVILPSANVVHVQPSAQLTREMQGNSIAAFGLNGVVTSADIYGMTVEAVRQSINNNDAFASLYDLRDESRPPVLKAVLDLYSRSALTQFVDKRFV
ncbi:hypothetical protein ONZ45_g7861 [Pleurotus djamor]|nr:hypothetical protein ONZ45_g7861 [Pleurotus djamor]